MSAQGGSERQALVKAEAPVPMDGSSAVEARRQRMHRKYCALMAVYIIGGIAFYSNVEGWSFFECTIFLLSILTGCGYGHLIPQTDAGLLVTSVYIFLGLVLFASIAGQILDIIMESEISAVMDAVKAGGSDDNVDTHYKNAQKLDKKRQFFVGCINLAVLCVGAVILFQLAFGEDFVHALYLASVSVLKMDSVCLLDGVQCSQGRMAHSGGATQWILFAIFWYIVTYGIIGHFMVSASNYLGVDPEASVSQIKTLSHERLQRMDNDGDGHVSRSEFLRDRLIQDGLVEEDAIDAILKNFDHLDKDGSGKLNKHDMGRP